MKYGHERFPEGQGQLEIGRKLRLHPTLATAQQRSKLSIVLVLVGATALSGCAIGGEESQTVESFNGRQIRQDTSFVLTPTKEETVTTISETKKKDQFQKELEFQLIMMFVQKASTLEGFQTGAFAQAARNTIEEHLKGYSDEISRDIVTHFTSGPGLWNLFSDAMYAASNVATGYLIGREIGDSGSTTAFTTDINNDNGNRIDVGAHKNDQKKKPHNKNHR